ncbi:choice-of-anchor D domain-containing protein [Aureispira anguillae]|uniref:Choice-of-anchor D domain-containing protein n=1 Tax=Aureispira anguillae TaxID=2864201 RepID=A0A915YHH7_9BACT|nr:choice-of-anchor D domain-containing protein [Aureispira anguillae]BDS13277.1 choice-of-anchor D domain-containing protein [Aureispira anguillae]
MKQILCTLLLLLCFQQYGSTQISYTGCNGSIAAGYPITLNLAGTVGTRNTYVNTLPGTPCSAGTCAFRVIWTGTQWEIQLSTNGGASYPNVLYANTTASFPDPPDLTLGTWVAQGPCGGQALTTWTGNVQSTVSSGGPEIDLIGNSVSIADGDATPSTTDDTDFGNVNLGGNDVHTFTIDNTAGTAALNVSTITVTGTHSGDFVVGGITLPAVVAAGGSTTFTITFTPATAGLRTATVTVNSDDADEAAYDYAVQGTGIAAPEIDLIGNSVSIADGDVTPSTTDDTDFGNVNLGSNDVHTFTIDNAAGTATLNVASIAVSGTHSGDFVVGGITLPAAVAAGASTTFTVTFTPAAAGLRTATVTVNSDDADEAAYDYAVQGTGIANPEIDLIGNSVSIVDGDATPSTTDDTDFGSVTTGNNDVHTFTIDNTAGTGTLNVASIAMSGTHSGDFVIGGITLPANITAGATATFTVTFTPGAVGVRDATVTVNNNDANEAAYDFAVRGTGVATIAITEWITNPSGNDATDEWVELYNFGASPVDIQNWRIQDEDVDNDLITTNSFVIPAGGYVIIAKNKAAFQTQWLGGCPSMNVFEVAGLTLSNGTDEIIIRDASNNIVWSVAYQNDDASGIAAHYTDAPTFTNSIWGSKASPGVDRTGNDPATGTLGYENNNTTADPNVMTSTTGDMGSPFDGTYTAPTKDIVRGDVLDFDGTDDFITAGNPAALNITTNITLEAWVKVDNVTGDQKIITKFGDVAFDDSYSLQLINGEPNFHLDLGAGWQVCGAGSSISVGLWYHIVGTYDGTNMKIYVNGIERNSIAQTGVIDVSTSTVKIGAWAGGNYLNGQMDEVRIWSTARTATEIRENMHLTLKDCPAGLVAYYQMNDGTGSSTLADHSGQGNNGTLTNMDPATDWVTSNVNVGNDAGGTSNSQTINVLAGVSTHAFTNANASLDFLAHSGAEDFTVTYQAFAPNAIGGVSGTTIIQNPMWTVNKSLATETQLVNYTFTFPAATFTSTDPTKYSLYYRTASSGAIWTKIATAQSITATTARFTKISLTGQFMVVQESENEISDVRGNMYNFDGVDDRIDLGAALLPTTGVQDFSISAWIKTTTNDGGIITQYQSSSNSIRFGLRTTTGELVYWKAGVIAATSTGANINDGNWHHIAITRASTGAINLYIDGVVNGTGSDANAIQNANTVIGNFGLTTNVAYGGGLDEVRIWSTVRTEAEIRENMHLTLKGNETGLVAYYQFNNDDPAGTAGGVKDALGTNNGTTINVAAADYMPSEVAVAGGTSDRVTIGAGGLYNFPNTSVSIEFGANTPNGEIVISRLETEKPHGWEAIGTDVDNEYFVVKNYGTNMTFDPLVDITFNRLSYVSPLDAGLAQASSPLQLYKRADNAFGPTWGTSFGGADNASAGTNAMISYNATNNINSFSQIVLANNNSNSDLPVELMRFEADRLNADKVKLSWSTATEINNQGFFIERMLATETEFKEVGYLEGLGNTVSITNYQLVDENSYSGVSYYRLRQVDFDGTITYSKIKAVEGKSIKNNNNIDAFIYPNPVYSELNVRFNELPRNTASAKVEIRTVTGQVMQAFSVGVQAYQTLEIEVDQLAPAVYILSIELDNKERIIQEFIKQ